MKKRGQSLVEVVVAVGVVILAISGVVALLVNVLGARTRSFDRVKATELAQKVIETMVADKNQRGDVFWAANYWTNNYTGVKTDASYVGYFYNVTIVPIDANNVEANVAVGWNESTDTVLVTRLFTRYQ